MRRPVRKAEQLANGFARALFGLGLLLIGLAVLGFEMRVAFRLNESLHYFHVGAAVILVLASWATIFTQTAGKFFGWLATLARSLRSGAK